jgi:hypothetical protein
LEEREEREVERGWRSTWSWRLQRMFVGRFGLCELEEEKVCGTFEGSKTGMFDKERERALEACLRFVGLALLINVIFILM